jgi:hypothetical protein
MRIVICGTIARNSEVITLAFFRPAGAGPRRCGGVAARNARAPERIFPLAERRYLFVYIDELQSVATLALVNPFSELHKYCVGFTVAHQHLHQLDPDLRYAIFSNAGSVFHFE